MALFATHLRFAAACAENGGNKNGEYYAGAIYPDSRYTTGTAREITHSMQRRSSDAELHDLFRGIQTHLFYDEFSKAAFESIFPHLEDIASSVPTWELFTAAKIINDIESYAQLRQNNMLHLFELPYQFTSTVHGESVSALNTFLQSIREMYSKEPTRETYINMLEYFHIDQHVLAGVSKNIELIQSDTTQLHAIKAIFPHAVTNYNYE